MLIDTNVLLADTAAMFGYPDAEVVIPETVLAELDKLKTSRVDPDLRFRGREVSRVLFELSEQGSLTEGIALPGGGVLRVVPFESDDIPEGLSARNSDDRILAVAMQVCGKCDDLTIVTNDLNMLLKAQTLGLKVERREGDTEGSFSRRYIIKPFQRYRVPLTILAIALAVFGAIIVLVVWSGRGTQGSTGLPSEFRDVLTSQQEAFYDAIVKLDSKPTDTDARLTVGNTYFDLYQQTKEIRFANLAARNYEEYLALRPNDPNARSDYATVLYNAGQTDKAIQEVGKVLQAEPDHIKANFNLGMFYWRGRNDLPGGYVQFTKVEKLTEGSSDTDTHAVFQSAKSALAQISKEASAAGVTLPGGGAN